MTNPITLADALRDNPVEPTTAPVPCIVCGGDVCDLGIRDVRDPIEGGLVITCPACEPVFLSRRRQAGLSILLDRAKVPSRYRDAEPKEVDARLWKQVKDWQGNPDMLTLIGPVGTGKSMAAACLVRDLLLAGQRVTWARPMDVIDTLKADFDRAPEVMERLGRVPFLVLDDLGTERWTDYAYDRMHALLFRRWDEETATIVTTNATPQELQAASPKLASRLLGGLVFALTGKDRRIGK